MPWQEMSSSEVGIKEEGGYDFTLIYASIFKYALTKDKPRYFSFYPQQARPISDSTRVS